MIVYRNQLTVLQYNIRKSKVVIMKLFENESIYNIDISII